MLTLLLAVIIGLILAFTAHWIYPSIILSIILFFAGFIACNVIVGRQIMKKLTAIFNSSEKDLKLGKTDIAIEKIKKGFAYSKWQLMVSTQINSQIGMILYASKHFDEALPYLKKSMKRNWMAMAMLSAYYYRQKNYEEAVKIITISSKTNPKDSFTQCLCAYMLSETGHADEAIKVLIKANKKLPTDERIENALGALRNHKKIKIQAYGALWLQLHLAKTPDGVKQYQTLIGRQKIKRR